MTATDTQPTADHLGASPAASTAGVPAPGGVPTPQPAGVVTYRPMTWEDVDAIVNEYDRTWGAAEAAEGTDSAMLSRHFVLHYLSLTTHGEVAELDGMFVGVICTRIMGEPYLFPQTRHELERVDEAMRAERSNARALEHALHWRALEEDMERDTGVNDTTQAEVELFIVSRDARGHGVGGTLWRHALDLFRRHDVCHYYLHTDSDCDVSYYDHIGMRCAARRLASDHPDDRRMPYDIYIYVGDM